MGWHRNELGDVWLNGSGQIVDWPYRYASPWNLLENIADAWMIVEKFDGYCLSGPPHYCILQKYKITFDSLGETIEQAICEAALKVIKGW